MLSRLYWSAFAGLHAWRDSRIPWWPFEEVLALQQRRLRAIVDFAYRHVPHYRDAMDRLGLRPADFRCAADLARLPLISKREVSAAPERFRPPAAVLRPALQIQSSGTTGRPGYVDYDARALFLSLAGSQRRRDAIAPFAGAGFGFRELSVVRPGSVSTQMRRFYEQNCLTPRRIDLIRSVLSPSEPFGVVLERLNEFRPTVLHGYGSYLGAFFRWVHTRGLECHKPGVLTYGADCMPESDRRLIEERMGIPVFSFYQSVEALRIAYQCEQRHGLHIFSDHVAVRVVDGDGNTLPPGVPGELVISNLTNRAIVLLNYRQGDVVTLGADACPCGRGLPTLAGIQGRQDDLIALPDGSMMHPLAVIALLQRIPGVAQVQLVQQELRAFQLKTVPGPGADWDAVSEQIEATMRSALGADIKLDLEPCERIPPGPSGKVRAVISMCRN